LVGIDGSHQATVAGDVALGLADRFGAAGAAAALIETAHEADLVVVGSRGLHGLKALGSVSERVAHRANCSVLVVRPTKVNAG